MSVADNFDVTNADGIALPMPSTTQDRPWHRIAEVRRQQNVSIRSLTRKMGLSAEEIVRQEDPTCNLTIEQLTAWQQALEVPLANLLIDLDAPLSGPVLTRARMLRLMKTVQAMRDSAKDTGMQRMTTMLVDQLTELMPELREVSGWHTVGQRRTQDEVGRIAERPINDNFVQDSLR